MIRLLRLSIVGVVASAGAACSGDLDTVGGLWTVTVESPIENDRVPFCPAILREPDGATLDGTFEPTANVVTSVSGVESDEDDHLWSVGGLSPADGFTQPSPTFAGLFEVSASFDVGPIGSIYDDGTPATLNWSQTNGLSTPLQTVSIVRTLVGGSKKSDDEVELSFAYEMSCEKLTVVDSQGTEHSCDCVDQTITYTLDGTP